MINYFIKYIYYIQAFKLIKMQEQGPCCTFTISFHNRDPTGFRS